MSRPCLIGRITCTVLALMMLMGQGCPPITLPQINPADTVPTANAGPDNTLLPGQSTTLDGSGSSDPDGDSLSYSWTQTYGPEALLSNELSMHPSVTLAERGVYEFTLTVSDGRGGTDADTVRVTVSDDAAREDSCPNDPEKTAPGMCGCGVPETDSDSDGMPDCLDACPSDVHKFVPGVCGCGVAEVDRDWDGTPDCIDACPTDPAKIATGACGCGALETDSDSDGTPDCVDACPNDPDKTAPGNCGCNWPESGDCEPVNIELASFVPWPGPSSQHVDTIVVTGGYCYAGLRNEITIGNDIYYHQEGSGLLVIDVQDAAHAQVLTTLDTGPTSGVRMSKGLIQAQTARAATAPVHIQDNDLYLKPLPEFSLFHESSGPLLQVSEHIPIPWSRGNIQPLGIFGENLWYFIPGIDVYAQNLATQGPLGHAEIGNPPISPAVESGERVFMIQPLLGDGFTAFTVDSNAPEGISRVAFKKKREADPYSAPHAWANGIQVRGDNVYTSGNGRLSIFDVHDLAHPTLVGMVSWDVPEQAAFSGGLAISGDLAFAIDLSRLHVISIAQPTHPVIVGSYDIDARMGTVEGEYVYLLQDGGLTILRAHHAQH